MKNQKSKIPASPAGRKNHNFIRNIFKIYNLHVSVEDKKIVQGINLEINSGELHIIMGPNGSGKSTLVHSLMGSDKYHISCVKYQINNKSLVGLDTDEIVKTGLMMTFQNPVSIPGVGLASFIRNAYKELYREENLPVLKLQERIEHKAKELKLDSDFLRRSLNDGFSGGEKKKAEMLQLLILKPKFAIIDEIDTGLDLDALKIIALGIEELLQDNCGVVLITHNPRMLKYLHPIKVHVMVDGKFAREGGSELVKLIEEKGYAAVK